MTKAVKALTTTSSTINRRALFGGGSPAVVTCALPAASPASGMAAAPSPMGRRVLALIVEQQALEAVWESDEDAASVRNYELFDAIEAIGRSITARPIASVSDIIDRAILAAWVCRPHGGRLVPDDVGGLQGAYIVDVLALAGVGPRSAMWNLRLRSGPLSLCGA